MKWFIHDHYVAIGLLLSIGGVAVASYLSFIGADWKVFITVFGGLFTFVFLVQKHQLEEAKFANELIVRFNQRYDSLNEDLNALLQVEKAASEFTSKELDFLFDYFNLCGEEFLFFKKGYIYPEVWKSWVAGMNQFHKLDGIRELWEQELTLGSYYGLDVANEIRAQVSSTESALDIGTV